MYRGTCDLDFVVKLGHNSCVTPRMETRRKPQRAYCVGNYDWRTASPPVMWPQKPPPSGRFHYPANVRSVEHGGFPPKPSAFCGKQFYHPPAPKNSAIVPPEPMRPVTSMKYLDNASYYQSDYNPAFHEAQCYFQANKSVANPRNVVTSPKLTYSGVEDPALNVECEKSSDVFTALVNRLLDDIDNDSMSVEDANQLPSVSEGWCLGNETIGELAIKLADLALMDDPIPMKPQIHSNASQEYSLPNPQLSAPEKPVLGASGGASEEHSQIKERGCFKVHRKQHVPQFNPHVTVFTKGIGNTGKKKKMTARASFKHCGAGSSPWMQLPSCKNTSGSTGSKSGSSSSSSSVHRESVIHPSSSDFMKYKLAPKRSDLEGDSSKPSYRPRKAYSSSSSGSGGRGRFSECVFCKTNGETSAIYRGHVLKDERGRTVCKVLQKYVCPLCGATGVNAHTVKYCPKNDNPPPIATMTTLKSMRTSTGRKRHGSGQVHQVGFDFNRNLLPA